MNASATHDALAGVVARAGSANLRAWSLAVSFLGDCIAPRGSDVGMAAITDILAALGVDPGVTRTSMSRLAIEGWVTRRKVGRRSFYSLTPAALAESEAASRLIYAARHPDDPCGWRVYLGGDLPKLEQTRLRAALRRRGAAELGAHVYVLPAGEDPSGAELAIVLTANPLAIDEARRLVRRAFDLEAIGEEYANFVAAFAPALASLKAGQTPAGRDAVAMRVFLIHCFRRIVLRDPGVPAPYLPDNWPGLAAHEIASGLWRALFRASEGWLDANAGSAAGRLPPRMSAWRQF